MKSGQQSKSTQTGKVGTFKKQEQSSKKALSHLKINHLPRLWGLGTLARDLQHRDPIPTDFLLQVTELSLHLVTSTDLIDEFALERVHVWV